MSYGHGQDTWKTTDMAQGAELNRRTVGHELAERKQQSLWDKYTNAQTAVDRTEPKKKAVRVAEQAYALFAAESADSYQDAVRLQQANSSPLTLRGHGSSRMKEWDECRRRALKIVAQAHTNMLLMATNNPTMNRCRIMCALCFAYSETAKR